MSKYRSLIYTLTMFVCCSLASYAVAEPPSVEELERRIAELSARVESLEAKLRTVAGDLGSLEQESIATRLRISKRENNSITSEALNRRNYDKKWSYQTNLPLKIIWPKNVQAAKHPVFLFPESIERAEQMNAFLNEYASPKQ